MRDVLEREMNGGQRLVGRTYMSRRLDEKDLVEVGFRVRSYGCDHICFRVGQCRPVYHEGNCGLSRFLDAGGLAAARMSADDRGMGIGLTTVI